MLRVMTESTFSDAAHVRAVIFSVLLLSALNLVGCGGGGGGDSENDDVGDLPLPPAEDIYDPTVFNGTYAVSYRLVSNDCPSGSPLANLDESFTVTSDVGFRGLPINRVVLSTRLELIGYTTKGNSDGATFFTAASDLNDLPEFVEDAACQEALKLYVVNTDARGNRITNVTRTSDIICRFADANFDFGCTVVYQGTGDIR